MFDVGFVELLLFGTICLLVLGPERLPHAARLAGGLLAKSRRAVQDLKHTLEVEMHAQELQERLKQIEQNAQVVKDQVQEATSEMAEQCELSQPSELTTSESTPSKLTPKAATPDSTQADNPLLDNTPSTANVKKPD